MITEDELVKLSIDFSNSWAIWPEAGESDEKFFIFVLGELHINSIFLGYMHSNEELKSPFINFHNKSYIVKCLLGQALDGILEAFTWITSGIDGDQSAPF